MSSIVTFKSTGVPLVESLSLLPLPFELEVGGPWEIRPQGPLLLPCLFWLGVARFLWGSGQLNPRPLLLFWDVMPLVLTHLLPLLIFGIWLEFGEFGGLRAAFPVKGVAWDLGGGVLGCC